MEEAVLRWVSRDPAGYGYLLDFYRRGARVCQAGEDGLVLKNDEIDLCYAGGSAFAPELLSCSLSLVEDPALAERIMTARPELERMECTQCLYLKKDPPPDMDRPGVTLRPLTMEDLDFVLQHYHHPGAVPDHIRGRIQEGMLGAELEGQLAGFIGVHEEGTIGLLEVLPAYRRRGLAEALEAALIRRQLERGRLPYGHVKVGNAASEALQKKLGLTFDRRVLYWLG